MCSLSSVCLGAGSSLSSAATLGAEQWLLLFNRIAPNCSSKHRCDSTSLQRTGLKHPFWTSAAQLLVWRWTALSNVEAAARGMAVCAVVVTEERGAVMESLAPLVGVISRSVPLVRKRSRRTERGLSQGEELSLKVPLIAYANPAA